MNDKVWEILKKEVEKKSPHESYCESLRSVFFSSSDIESILDRRSNEEIDSFFTRLTAEYDPTFRNDDNEERKKMFGKDLSSAFHHRRNDEKEDDDGILSSIRKLQIMDQMTFFELKMKQIEALIQMKDFIRASVYSEHLLSWMVQDHESERNLASRSPQMYSLVSIWHGEAVLGLGDFRRALEDSSKAFQRLGSVLRSSILSPLRLITESRHFLFQRLVQFYEETNLASVSSIIEAKIVVDPDRPRGFDKTTKQFIVGDLETALRIAKDRDVIFLQKGDYDCTKKSNKKLEVHKSVTLIGHSSSETVIRGSIVKWGTGKLTLKNLKLCIGSDSESNDDFYIMGGMTLLKDCLVECPVNTAIYILNNETAFHASFVIFDGLESCLRIISPEGSGLDIQLDHCYIRYAFSFLTSTTEKCEGSHISMRNSSVYSIQDGLRLTSSSKLRVEIEGCQFGLMLMNPDVSSAAVSLCGGTDSVVSIVNNVFFSHHIDGNGVELKNVKSAKVTQNLIETTSIHPRKLGLAEGLILSGESLEVTHLQVVGFRIGVNVFNEESFSTVFFMRDCSAQSCSVGVFINGKKKLESRLSGLNFNVCYSGVIVDGSIESSSVETSRFLDVVNPVVVRKTEMRRLVLWSNEYILSKDFDDDVTESNEYVQVSKESGYSQRKHNMYLYFAVKENMPSQISIASQDFICIET